MAGESVVSASTPVANQPNPFMGALGAGLGAVGSIVGGIMGNKSSAKQAKKQRQWAEYMANTAHQREVADLRAAGLNPILSATGGSGAATPSGASAQQEDVVTPAVGSAMQMMREISNAFKSMADAQKTVAETTSIQRAPDYHQAQADQASSAAALNRKTEELKEYDRRIQEAIWENPTYADILRSNPQLDNAIKRQDLAMAEREAKKMQQYGKWDDSKWGPVLMFLERIFGGILKGRK